MKVLLQIVTEWPDPISWAIRLSTRSWESHAEFVLEDGMTLGSHAQGGVRMRPYQHRSYSHTERYDAPQINQAFAWATSQIGKKYDFSAIFGIATDRDWHDSRRWFCSELIAEAFERAGAPLLNPNVDTWRITPRDLLLSPAIRFSQFAIDAARLNAAAQEAVHVSR